MCFPTICTAKKSAVNLTEEKLIILHLQFQENMFTGTD